MCLTDTPMLPTHKVVKAHDLKCGTLKSVVLSSLTKRRMPRTSGKDLVDMCKHAQFFLSVGISCLSHRVPLQIAIFISSPAMCSFMPCRANHFVPGWGGVVAGILGILPMSPRQTTSGFGVSMIGMSLFCPRVLPVNTPSTTATKLPTLPQLFKSLSRMLDSFAEFVIMANV